MVVRDCVVGVVVVWWGLWCVIDEVLTLCVNWGLDFWIDSVYPLFALLKVPYILDATELLLVWHNYGIKDDHEEAAHGQVSYIFRFRQHQVIGNF